MNICIINNHSAHAQEVASLFPGHVVTYVDVLTADYTTITADLVVLTGAHDRARYTHTFDREIDFILTTPIPVVGICMGCELLVRAYGGTMIHHKDKIEGIRTIQKNADNGKDCLVYEGHTYCISDIDDVLEGIYMSTYGYEVIQHRVKKQRGLQFHPEVVSPENDGKTILHDLLVSHNILV